VYLALLKLHAAMAGEISQKSGIHRRTVYPIIENLMEKGLVKAVERGGNKYYEALSPRNLLALTRKKKDGLQRVLPPLTARYEDTKDTQVINFFKGPEGIKTILDDIILKGQEVLVIGAITVPQEFVDIFRRYRTRRLGKEIRSRLLFTEDQRGQFKNIELDRVRYLPQEYKNPATTAVYANKVGIILFTKEPVAISIKVPDIVESYRNYFELLWEIAKE
jgi:sugar-specific transcriptional regulator TrmB